MYITCRWDVGIVAHCHRKSRYCSGSQVEDSARQEYKSRTPRESEMKLTGLRPNA